MTCIVGIAREGKVYMGGDSAGGNSSSWQCEQLINHKVFINGEFLIGYTSSFRMGELLQFNLVPPKQKQGQDDITFMCTDFVNAVRECLAAGGFKTVDKNVESGGTFLIGYHGGLYKIQDDFAVLQSAFSLDACGCGEQFAIAAATALKGIIDYPIPEPEWTRTIIRKALEIAERYSGGVKGPFKILEI